MICTYNTSYLGGSWSETYLGKCTRLISKTKLKEKGLDVAELEGCLVSSTSKDYRGAGRAAGNASSCFYYTLLNSFAYALVQSPKPEVTHQVYIKWTPCVSETCAFPVSHLSILMIRMDLPR
jgi:hypothetical protein